MTHLGSCFQGWTGIGYNVVPDLRAAWMIVDAGTPAFYFYQLISIQEEEHDCNGLLPITVPKWWCLHYVGGCWCRDLNINPDALCKREKRVSLTWFVVSDSILNWHACYVWNLDVLTSAFPSLFLLFLFFFSWFTTVTDLYSNFCSW